MKITVTKRELTTILAGLRIFQSIHYGDGNTDVSDIFFSLSALNASQIDELCERLNCEE